MPRYEFSEGSSNKFWEIELKGSDFTTTYGKIGAAGQTTLKNFKDEAAAKKEYEKLISEKVKKGYQLVSGGKPASPPVAEKPAAKAPAKPRKITPAWKWENKKAGSLLSLCEPREEGYVIAWQFGFGLLDPNGRELFKESLAQTFSFAVGPKLLASVSDQERGEEVKATICGHQLPSGKLWFRKYDERDPEYGAAELSLVDDVLVVANVKPGLQAFEASGKELWSREAGENGGISEAKRFGPWALVTSFKRGKFVCEAIDAKTGKTAWTSPEKFFAHVANDQFLFGRDSGSSALITLDRKGKVVWTTDARSGISSLGAACDSSVLVVFDDANQNAPQLNAYEAATGKLRWSVELKKYSGPGRTPCIARGKVWVIDGSKQLLAFDVTTGAPVLQIPLPSPHLDHAVVRGDDVVAFTRYEGKHPLIVAFTGVA